MFPALKLSVDNPSNDIELHKHEHKCELLTSQSQKQLAVCIRNAHKSYGTIKPVVVLNGLDVTVPKGTIYGLLGASGCGKTTLLHCIIGCKRLNSGEIWVLGGTPGSRDCGAPGPRIGYMPQVTGLYGEFTVRETFLFYGRVVGMTEEKIAERCNFLAKSLMLPNNEESLKNLSGGEQRRVSLAVALLHEPELLILDEPTVGADPVLREIIWQHFIEIVKKGNTTIIITTHYIEETRQADIIGLMRGGYLLAEEPPDRLMLVHNAQTLEEVFLKLSNSQKLEHGRQHNSNHSSSNAIQDLNGVANRSTPTANIQPENSDRICETNATYHQIQNDHSETTQSVLPNKYEFHHLRTFRGSHMRALIWKNALLLNRNKPALLFNMVLPLAIIIMFCTYIGHDPVNVSVAVVNHETNNSKNCDNTLTCNSSQLSCSYLEYLERRALILIYYGSEEDAKQSVINRDTYASIVIKHNYSEAFRARVENGPYAKPWDLTYSEIEVIRDPGNKHLANYLNIYLYECFETIIKNYADLCSIHPKTMKLPLKWETPVYGTTHPTYTDFVLPGLLVSTIFFLALLLTAATMLIERNEASFERTLVTGINELELATSHFIIDFGIMIIQTALAMVSAFVIFHMTLWGSVLLVVLLLIFTGFCGMCYGLLLSCVFETYFKISFAGIGSYLPLIVVCGVVWPLEGMHYLLQPFAYIFPLTYPIESLRSILQKDWGLSSKSVYMGFIAINVWTAIFLSISILVLKFKRY